MILRTNVLVETFCKSGYFSQEKADLKKSLFNNLREHVEDTSVEGCICFGEKTVK